MEKATIAIWRHGVALAIRVEALLHRGWRFLSVPVHGWRAEARVFNLGLGGRKDTRGVA